MNKFLGFIGYRPWSDYSKREAFLLGLLVGMLIVLLFLVLFQPTPEQYCGGYETCVPL